MTIKEIHQKYHAKIDTLDLELIIAHEIGKTREFVLAHPEFKLTKNQELKTKNLLARKAKHEPLAYILGHREFFGLDFKVNRHTPIPRPETELLVELALKELQPKNYQPKTTVIDIGTGSGNIIISIAHNIKHGTWNNVKFFATDISANALKIAKQNAKLHKVDKKIKFIRGNLLEPVLKKCSVLHAPRSMVILANLPYLSKKIYASTPKDVKNFEPKSALYSKQNGLRHYIKLLKQINKLKNECFMFYVLCFMEFSPEQKPALEKLIKSALPGAKVEFSKDLAGKWRVCHILLGF